ncbi:MAG: hypothetical protein AAGB02_02360 [Pseudomonadota bacterium]
MIGSGYVTRLGAALATAAIFGAMIANPNAGKHYVEQATIAAAAVERTPLSARACAIGEPAFAGPFADLDDILSISPLGGVTAPGEVLPAPYIRLNTRAGETAFERRQTSALAPARADVTAIERHIDRDAYGRATAQRWTVHFRSCEKIHFYYGRLDSIAPELLEKAGGLDRFSEFGGPDHIALETNIRVGAGDVIGVADGFDVGLHDLAAAPAEMARPARYRTNPYIGASIYDAPASLVKAINPPTDRARCPIDYLPKRQQADWAAKLGDVWGIRKAKGEDACRTALIDRPSTLQGAWFTDSSHNGVASKVSAIALAPDTIDPDRQIFSLHGRLASLTPDLVALAPKMDSEKIAAAKDFLSFEKGDGRINPAFSDITDDSVYCYEGLRANFVGPLINGVILVQRRADSEPAGSLRIEARGDVLSCTELDDPWEFSGNETIFFR